MIQKSTPINQNINNLTWEIIKLFLIKILEKLVYKNISQVILVTYVCLQVW